MSLTAEMAGGVPDELRGAIKAFHDGDGSLPESRLLLRETVRVLTTLIRAAVIQEGGSLQGENDLPCMRLLPWRATCYRVLDLLAEACLSPPAAAARAELKRIVSRGWRVQPPALAPPSDVPGATQARDSPQPSPPQALACPQ